MPIDPRSIVSLHPYFKIHPGKLEEFAALLPQFVEKTATEEHCLQYGFTINGDVAFCRESYVGAEAVLHHLENVGEPLAQALKISDLFRVELHGSAEELAKLKEPLAEIDPDWFEYVCGVGD